MSKQKIYKEIITLSNDKRNLTRKELEDKIINIAALCSNELETISIKSAERYKLNEHSKLIRTRNNCKRAIKMLWNKRKNDRVVKARILNHIETLRKVYKIIGKTK